MAAVNRGRRRRPNRGRNRNDNYGHEEVQEDPALVWLARTLVPRSLTLPITTRGIGMSVCSLVRKSSPYYYCDDTDSSSDKDEIVIQKPDIFALYRVCLGLLEYRLWSLKICSPADMYQYKMTNLSIQSFWVPKDIQCLINAVGIFEHNETTYIPAVAKDVDGVPRPENLLLSNLRRAVDLLSKPETPFEHRKYFFDHNPIPGAQWNRTECLLLNADEIIEADYGNLTSNFSRDWYTNDPYFHSLRRYSERLPEFAGGYIDLTLKGEKSLLISNKMETFDCYLQGDIGDCYALARLSGGTVRLLGECPKTRTFTDPVYKMRSETVAGLRVFFDNVMDKQLRSMSPYPLKLSVTTRGIGMSVCCLINTSSSYHQIEKPDVYALYRLCLGLLEVKLSKISFDSRFFSMINSAKYILVPKQIHDLISAVGTFEHEGLTYVPAVAKDMTDNLGPVPRPENLLLSNLRRAVELLSNPETPVEHRKYFHDHNPIPGAQWDKEKYLLLNANEIIKADYHENFERNFFSDRQKLQTYFHSFCFYSMSVPKLTCESINMDSRNAPLHSLLISNEIGKLRVPDRATDEELFAYCKRCRPEGNIEHYYALARMSGSEVLLGTSSLLGEYPVPDSCDPIYNLRDKAVARFRVNASYNQAIYMLNRVKIVV